MFNQFFFYQILFQLLLFNLSVSYLSPRPYWRLAAWPRFLKISVKCSPKKHNEYHSVDVTEYRTHDSQEIEITRVTQVNWCIKSWIYFNFGYSKFCFCLLKVTQYKSFSETCYSFLNTKPKNIYLKTYQSALSSV